MNRSIVVTGTDTGIGKTVFAAALASSLGASYWKPVQAGLDCETDSETVMRLGGLTADRILPESYRLRTPVSPHRAAEIDGIAINPITIALPACSGPLVIEGAGGLMVPLTRDFTMIDLFSGWQLPVILCARTGLGTINHTLLSLEALRHRSLRVRGIVFIGDAAPASEAIIADLGRVRVLGRLPLVLGLSAVSLGEAFDRAFCGTCFLDASRDSV